MNRSPNSSAKQKPKKQVATANFYKYQCMYDRLYTVLIMTSNKWSWTTLTPRPETLRITTLLASCHGRSCCWCTQWVCPKRCRSGPTAISNAPRNFQDDLPPHIMWSMMSVKQKECKRCRNLYTLKFDLSPNTCLSIVCLFARDIF